MTTPKFHASTGEKRSARHGRFRFDNSADPLPAGPLLSPHFSTGRVSRIELPAGMVFSDPPTWVTATEIGIAGRYREEGRFTSTFFRIAIPE